jgi:hypothetical protein
MPVDSFAWRALVSLTALLGIGCAGTTATSYKGTVTSASAAGHSFDDEPNPARNPPVPNARVNVYVTNNATYRCSETESGLEKRTDAYGNFEIPEVVFSGIWFTDNHVYICVDHPTYQKYQYQTIHYKTKDPEHSEKFLNIVLVRRRR